MIDEKPKTWNQTPGSFTCASGRMHNFSPSTPVELCGLRFRTSEDLYQAGKFPEQPDFQHSLAHPGSDPKSNKRQCRTLEGEGKRRLDWFQVRAQWMLYVQALRANQHPSFAELLVSTGDTQIIGNAGRHYDPYWGTDARGFGTNALGQALQVLRNIIQGKTPSQTIHAPPGTKINNQNPPSVRVQSLVPLTASLSTKGSMKP